ncbi:hypothetical protein Tco_1481262 [Tanacetum coccineum]
MQHESCVEESYVKICIGGSWCEDADETEVKNVVVPFERERKASKACQSTFVQQPPTTQVKRKRRRKNRNNPRKRFGLCLDFGPDGNEIPLLP